MPTNIPAQRRPRQVVTVWSFEDAPPSLQALSPNGGDEDWLVHVLDDQAFTQSGLPYWLEVMDSCRDPHRIELPNGAAVYIGCHS